MRTVPQWRLVGDRFEICPAPSRDFPEAPTNNAGQVMLAWHIRRGHYRDVRLDGFNLMAVAAFEAATRTLFIEDGTDLPQREALQTIFAGRAGGRQARMVASVDEFKDVEFVPITFEMADDLAFWRVEIPDGRVPVRRRDSPSTLARPQVQTIDFARSELSSGQIAGWADSVTARTEGFGFRWMGESRPSRHIRLEGTSPDHLWRSASCLAGPSHIVPLTAAFRGPRTHAPPEPHAEDAT